jgi:hypothetical protein
MCAPNALAAQSARPRPDTESEHVQCSQYPQLHGLDLAAILEYVKQHLNFPACEIAKYFRGFWL